MRNAHSGCGGLANECGTGTKHVLTHSTKNQIGWSLRLYGHRHNVQSTHNAHHSASAHTSTPYSSALAKHLQVASDHPLSHRNLSLEPSLCTHTHTPCTHTERTTNTSTSTNTRTNTQTHAPSTHTRTCHAHIHARARHAHIQAPSTRAQHAYANRGRASAARTPLHTQTYTPQQEIKKHAQHKPNKKHTHTNAFRRLLSSTTVLA